MASRRAAGKRHIGAYWPAELVELVDQAAAAAGQDRGAWLATVARAAAADELGQRASAERPPARAPELGADAPPWLRAQMGANGP